MTALSSCLDEVKYWLYQNLLYLNEEKTEVIVFGPSENMKTFNFDLGSLSAFRSSQVRNLGVLLDDSLKLDIQISTVIGSSFHQLRTLAKLNTFHTFITSRLDYCNSLYCGISKAQIARLQLVQNAASRFLLKKKKRDHATPLLKALHWLPVQFRIHYKILLFVFKSLHNQAPGYLSELLHQYIPLRSLRSCDQNLLLIPHSRLKRGGDRAFSVIGPRLWNDLPVEIRMAPSLPIFKSLLKTHLFSLAH